MSKYPLTKIIDELPASVPFVGPETSERQTGVPFTARIGANENGYGPSPKAIEAMRSAAAEIWMYGDSESYDLRRALAEYHGVGFDNIVVGEGIDGLLGYTCRLFVCPGRHVVTSEGAYPTFNFYVENNGGELHFQPLKDDFEDLDALLATANETNATLIYVSNPNNPMASCHPAARLQDAIDQIPDGKILILDEAYIELAPSGSTPAIDLSNPRVLRYRTFSKAYAMAGARVGYCIGEAGLIGQMEKVRNHFGMNRVAQIGALAALEDQEYLSYIIEKNAAGRLKLEKIAAKFGMKTLPSATNFVAIDCGRDAQYAKAIVDKMMAKGIFIRMPGVFPQSRCIRVSIGTDDDINKFDVAFCETLEELK